MTSVRSSRSRCAAPLAPPRWLPLLRPSCRRRNTSELRRAGRAAQGVVTHCTDVKPLISVATYLDITSNVEIFQEVLGPMFTPVDKTSKSAKDVNPKGEPVLQMRGSKLVKFQQVKIQEMADEVPTSATPRCAPHRPSAPSRCESLCASCLLRCSAETLRAGRAAAPVVPLMQRTLAL